MNHFATFGVACALFFAGMTALAQPPQHTKDSLDTIKKSVTEKKAVLIDVREQKEWDAGHLRDAKLLPLSMINGKDKKADFAKDLPKDQVIYLHCASGKRCVTAAEELQKLGYDARPLKQGYSELIKAGFAQAGK
ncbi:MAG TPA: rhodanese-like domain-containing protein [Gemmataceae bacterium]|nr:rhodanese-like domain-containing protein [Gemmataceae bacterium]